MEHSTTLHSDSLETSSLSLKFIVNEFHFRGGNMKLKCTATISRVYTMSNEELVFGTGLRQQTSGLQITENMSHGHILDTEDTENLLKWLRSLVEVSEKLGIAQSIISRLWQRFQVDDNVNRCQSTGRPRVTTPNEDRYIYLAVTAKRNRWITASDLSRQLSSATGTIASRQTVYRRLGATRTRYHQENNIERHRYGGAGWLVWGGIIIGSRTDLHVQSVTMTVHIYRDVILEQRVRLFRGTMGAEFLFMDDNARPYRANIVD
ncbi:transposable element Tcb1 transposase [Trichonephila clavipes]|nr:transposable element Tcb1 transposase [Trichonephila clavipes]